MLVIAGTEPVLTDTGVDLADGIYRPTAVCDEGISDKLGIDLRYLRKLRGQAIDLYDVNVNGDHQAAAEQPQQAGVGGGDQDGSLAGPAGAQDGVAEDVRVDDDRRRHTSMTRRGVMAAARRIEDGPGARHRCLPLPANWRGSSSRKTGRRRHLRAQGPAEVTGLRAPGQGTESYGASPAPDATAIMAAKVDAGRRGAPVVSGPGTGQTRSMATGGGKARLLCTVQCETTAYSAGRRSAGRSAGARTVRRMPLTRAGRSLAMSNPADTASPSRLYP